MCECRRPVCVSVCRKRVCVGGQKIIKNIYLNILYHVNITFLGKFSISESMHASIYNDELNIIYIMN